MVHACKESNSKQHRRPPKLNSHPPQPREAPPHAPRRLLRAQEAVQQPAPVLGALGRHEVAGGGTLALRQAGHQQAGVWQVEADGLGAHLKQQPAGCGVTGSSGSHKNRLIGGANGVLKPGSAPELVVVHATAC
jgi:hypothetical protein